MRDFRQLGVWEKAHQLVLQVYRQTYHFPKEELYGLTSQIRRAAISIPANIAEGCGRNGKSDFARFLNIAMGSASELECELLLARDLGFLTKECHLELETNLGEVKRMLTGFLQKIQEDIQSVRG